MINRRTPLFCLSTVAALLCLSGAAEDSPGTVLFSRDVLPILSDTCFQCHGPDSGKGRKGDLRLDKEDDAKRDRKGHRAITPGNPDASELIRRLLSKDPDEQMPPAELGRSLTTRQIDTLSRWIAGGAPWGKHWAFERIERPLIEETKAHPVDELVQRHLNGAGFKANPPAAKEALIRRLFLDLTGLPPTPSEIDAFLSDQKPDAWERLVDQTLTSPAFGERMAWDWLEAARYADSNGYQGDNERTMWPWRDWVVNAYNKNLPYDQFTLYQLAGDLLPNPSQEQILATGFNRNHMINGEGGRIAEENRIDYVMDMTETMGTVWLGLTLTCCRCHDHKFDPLTQADYYRFNAFFNQTPVTGAGGNPQTPPVLDIAPPDVIAARDTARKELNELRGRAGKAVESEKASLEKTIAAADTKLKSLEEAVPKVMVMADQKEKRKTFMLQRGLYNVPGEEVKIGLPDSILPLPDSPELNRLDLAKWLLSRDQPLTSRVAVNRLWQMLFGIGLVKTAEDFGVQSEYPLQRELLDWLAAEYMESGWDTKALLKIILTSDTYRRSSDILTPSDHERDPQNRWLTRGPRFRLPSWMIRDQALAASGLLIREAGGRPVYPYQPEGIWDEATFGKKSYPGSTGSDLHRRSLYTFWRRIVGPTEFFDTAKRQICEVKPLRTNTPMHALTTLNSPTYVEAGRALATDLLSDEANDDARLKLAGRRVLGRAPSAAEAAIWRRSLDRALTEFKADPEAAGRFLAHGATPVDPALSPVTCAAWTALCLNLLNLDETLNKE
ncbi:MAG: PSD1 domain-containing protein, partial [Verrucomicrobiales bacterium]|nr:PSD1 domain-containing protein [Verrucomicrobiales bacterium]